jgi:dynein heavy chain, axonemal
MLPDNKMASISAAGAGLLNWLVAIVNYCSVAKKVVPKRKAVEQAQKQQKQNQKDLENIKAEVQVFFND